MGRKKRVSVVLKETNGMSDSLFAVDAELGINLVFGSREEVDRKVIIRTVVIETTGVDVGLDVNATIHAEHFLRPFQPASLLSCTQQEQPSSSSSPYSRYAPRAPGSRGSCVMSCCSRVQ